jgi:hypothetical protein
MLEPPDVSDPPMLQLPPEVLSATIVLVIVRSPGEKIPPPRFAPFWAMVTFFSVADVPLLSAPPSVAAVLPLNVTLVRLDRIVVLDAAHRSRRSDCR